MTDFLGVADLGVDGLRRLVNASAELKQDRHGRRQALVGRSIGLFFEKPSTRTRVSCEVAAVEIGAHPVVLRREEIGLGDRESVADVARVLDRYLDALALRVFEHRYLTEIADHADAPVINLLSDLEHPCQAIADLQTIEEAKPIEDSIVTYVGDGNNVCHSLMLGVSMLGGEVRVLCPPGYEPSPEFVAASGDRVTVSSDVSVVDGSDVVYTDVWASMGQEDEAAGRAEVFGSYRIDDALFSRASNQAIFLHCLPAHRGVEVTDSVMDHERSRVFDQAENRLHAIKALFLELLA